MFKINYSQWLKWQVKISWSKNAALPIVSANYICDNKVNLINVPDIKDIKSMQSIAAQAIANSKDFFDLTDENVQKIRASILLIPFGLHRYWKVKFCGSWGCKIWKRPLDTFDDALVQAWVKVTQDWFKSYEVVWKPNKQIILEEFSVTATESLLTYLAFLEDVDYEITVNQIAIEPHVINTIQYLENLGAKIKVNYDHSVIIQPSKIQIKNPDFKIIWDYIQAWTYFGIGAIADNSEIIINWCNVSDLLAVLNLAKKIGINFEILWTDSIKVNSYNKANYKAIKLQTMIFPGFPTDLQSIFGTVLTQCDWVSKIFETLFEWRFAYLSWLENLGAKTEIFNPHTAIIVWPTKLQGWYVATTDLRWWGAMVAAWIIAHWTTFITNEDIILRWYDNIVENLKAIWVDIEHVE